ncbi:MAG: PadR family transcriptional regulator [Candidatus Bathyarchaeota archaeon]|nr:PadR family transcriptional regulator [Candidatus Bathyarchaeota archaeon]
MLLDLAVNGPATGYTLAERIKIPRSSAYDGLKDLLKQGCVVFHIDSDWGGVLEKKEYSLTVRGVVTALSLTDTREEVDAVAERWGGLIPLVLGKWNYLKNKVGGGKVYLRLGIATKAFLLTGFAASYEVLSFVPLTGPFPSDDEIVFTCLFYDPNLIVREYPNWIEVIKGDPDIRGFIIKILPSYKVHHDNWIKAYEKLMGGGLEEDHGVDPRVD